MRLLGVNLNCLQVVRDHVHDCLSHRLEEIERLIKGRVMHERAAHSRRVARRLGASDAAADLPDTALADAHAADPALQHVTGAQRLFARLHEYLHSFDDAAATAAGAPAIGPGPHPAQVVHMLREQQQELVSLVHHLAVHGEGQAARLATREGMLAEMGVKVARLEERCAEATQSAQQVGCVLSLLLSPPLRDTCASAYARAAQYLCRHKLLQHIRELPCYPRPANAQAQILLGTHVRIAGACAHEPC